MTDSLAAPVRPAARGDARAARSLRRRIAVVLVALAVLLGASLRFAGLNPALAQGPALVAYRAASDPGLDPGAAAWSDVTSTRLMLTSQLVAYPNQGVGTPFLEVKALHLEDRLFIRVEWPDATRDETTRAVENFADAVAVQFPAVAASTVPFVCMGQADQAVNIWQWRADSQVGLVDQPDAPNGYVDEYPNTSDLFYPARAAGNQFAQLGAGPIQNLVAGGFGTLSPIAGQVINGEGAYKDGHWAVVFERGYAAPGADQPTFEGGTAVDVAFAVWNGSEGDRNGKKSVSEFTVMELIDRVPGPDYPRLVGTFAVVAILLVLLFGGMRVIRPRTAKPRAPREPGRLA